MVKRGILATLVILIIEEIIWGIILNFVGGILFGNPNFELPTTSDSQTDSTITIDSTIVVFEPKNEIKSTYSIVEGQITTEDLENVFWGMHKEKKAKLEISEVVKSYQGDSLYFNFNIYFIDDKTGRLLSDQGQGIALLYKFNDREQLLYEIFLVGEYNFFEGDIGRMYDHETSDQYLYLNVTVQSKNMQFEFYNRRYNPILIEDNSNSIFND